MTTFGSNFSGLLHRLSKTCSDIIGLSSCLKCLWSYSYRRSELCFWHYRFYKAPQICRFWSSYQMFTVPVPLKLSHLGLLLPVFVDLIKWWFQCVCCFRSFLEVARVSVGFDHVQTHVLFVTKKLSAVGALEVCVVSMLLVAVVAQVRRGVEPLVALKTQIHSVNHACVVIELMVPLKRFSALHTAPRQRTSLIHSTVVHSARQNLWTGTPYPHTWAPRWCSMLAILPCLVWDLPDNTISVIQSSCANIA